MRALSFHQQSNPAVELNRHWRAALPFQQSNPALPFQQSNPALPFQQSNPATKLNKHWRAGMHTSCLSIRGMLKFVNFSKEFVTGKRISTHTIHPLDAAASIGNLPSY